MCRWHLDPAGPEEHIEVGGREAQQPTNFEIGDPSFGDQPPHVAVVDVEIAGRFSEGERPSIACGGSLGKWLRATWVGLLIRSRYLWWAHHTSVSTSKQVDSRGCWDPLRRPGHAASFRRTKRSSWAMASNGMPAARAFRTWSIWKNETRGTSRSSRNPAKRATLRS